MLHVMENLEFKPGEIANITWLRVMLSLMEFCKEKRDPSWLSHRVGSNSWGPFDGTILRKSGGSSPTTTCIQFICLVYKWLNCLLRNPNHNLLKYYDHSDCHRLTLFHAYNHLLGNVNTLNRWATINCFLNQIKSKIIFFVSDKIFQLIPKMQRLFLTRLRLSTVAAVESFEFIAPYLQNSKRKVNLVWIGLVFLV